MRLARATVFPLALSVLVLGCEDDEITGPELADLAGEWEATEFTYTHAQDPTVFVPIAQVGAFVVTVQESGAFAAILSIPNQETGELDDVPLSGTFSFQGDDAISIDFDTQTEAIGFSDFTVEYTLDGDTLTWSADDVDFDFDGDGTEEPATLSVVLNRTS